MTKRKFSCPTAWGENRLSCCEGLVSMDRSLVTERLCLGWGGRSLQGGVEVHHRWLWQVWFLATGSTSSPTPSWWWSWCSSPRNMGRRAGRWAGFIVKSTIIPTVLAAQSSRLLSPTCRQTQHHLRWAQWAWCHLQSSEIGHWCSCWYTRIRTGQFMVHSVTARCPGPAAVTQTQIINIVILYWYAFGFSKYDPVHYESSPFCSHLSTGHCSKTGVFRCNFANFSHTARFFLERAVFILSALSNRHACSVFL